MKTLIQNYKVKFQKTLDSLDLKRNPEMELVVSKTRSKIDLADYLLEKNVKTLRELENLKRQLQEMIDQIRGSSGCFDLKTKAEIIFRLESKMEFLKELLKDVNALEHPIFKEVQSFLSETLERANDLRDRIGNGLQTMNQSEMRKFDLLDEFYFKLVETIQEWNAEVLESVRLWK